VAAFGDRATAQRDARRRGCRSSAIIDIGLGPDSRRRLRALPRAAARRASRLPIIFLSARDSDFDIVSGLRLGADDYVTKDVSLPHLLARIAALFRRVDAAAKAPVAEDILQPRASSSSTPAHDRRAGRAAVASRAPSSGWCIRSRATPGHVKDRDQLMRDAEMVVDDGTITRT
jgi:two-component system OmpR family response regulator